MIACGRFFICLLYFSYMKKLLILFLILAIAGIGWWLGAPLFIDNTVDEALPFETMTEVEYQEMVDAVEEIDMELPSMDDMKTLTEAETKELEMEMLKQSAEMGDTMVDEPMNTDPVRLASGTFTDADNVHMGSGSAIIYEHEGEQLLRFEDFSVTNGPDLRVLLANDPDNLDAGYIELGRLKGNMGNQNYEIPSDIDASSYGGVVIYCKPFHVTFSTALF